MKNLCFILLTVCLIFISCNNDNESSEQEDYDRLSKMRTELEALSLIDTETCTNPNDWAYVKLGDGCDGEIDIVYSKKINTASFLIKAEAIQKITRNLYEKMGRNLSAVFLLSGQTDWFGLL